VRASSGRERGGRCSAFIERGEEREREGRRGGGNGRQWPLMVAITPLRERGRGGEGEETAAVSGSGSARPGAGSGAVSTAMRGGACPRARRWRLGDKGERRGGPRVGPTCHRDTAGRGGAAVGWAPNGPNSARVRVFRICFSFSFIFLLKNINKYIFLKKSKNHNNYSKIIYNQDIYFWTNISILINWIFNMKKILLNIQKSYMSKQKLF
jgi:hypothetical protein